MSKRALLRLLCLPSILALAACAGAPARRFGPASAEDVQEALTAWSAAQDRALRLAPSRLLYEAHLGKGALPSVPGTLAVTYDGQRIVAASLTGPFGSRIADYSEGTVTGQDRKAFVVDPEALRSVLAGVWSGPPSAVAGRDGKDCLLTWASPYPVEAVFDVQEQRLRSLNVSANGGRLEAIYAGSLDPWPERVALKEARSGRSISLHLLAMEPLEKGSMPVP